MLGIRWSLENMTEEEVRSVWTFGGYGEEEDFPGRITALLLMLRPFNKRGRRMVARIFAAYGPHSGARAVAALLRSRRSRRPISIPSPCPTPVRLTPQRRHARITPARAP